MLLISHCTANTSTFPMASLSKITSIAVAEDMMLSQVSSCAQRCPGTTKIKVAAVGFVKGFCLLPNHSDLIPPI